MSSRTLRTVVIGVAAVVVVLIVVLVTRDNKDGTSSTTTTAASQAAVWAEGTCNALVSWKTDVVTAVNTLKQTPTRDNAKQAATDAKTATLTLTDSLSALGTPGTSGGGKAHDTVQSLKTQMQTGLSKIQEASGKLSGISGSAEAVSTISSTLVTMRDQVAAAGTTLRALPSGELESAVASSPSCNKLKNGSSAS
jgi:hypothetical protein